MTKKNIYSILLPSHECNIKNIQGIKLTEIAKNQLLSLIKKNTTIKLGIKKTGCAGFKYFMEKTLNLSNNLSNITFFSKDISIIINKKDLNVLDGIKIDFVKEGLNYIFKFSHKKIKNFCGCGHSFEL